MTLASSQIYAWYVVILLTATQIVAYLDRFLPSLLLEPIKRSLHLSDLQVGLILGPAFALFYVFLGLPIGWLADRWSRRNILAIGIFIWCCVTAAGGFARGFLPLLAARLGLGVGEATVGPCAISLVSDYFPRERRARAFSVLMSGVFLGAGSAFLFGGPLVHRIEALPPFIFPFYGPMLPWQMCFLLFGLPGLVLAVLMVTTVREPARRDLIVVEPGKPSNVAPSMKDTLRFMTSRWPAFGTLIAGSACNLTLGSLTTWNVAFFARTWGWNVSKVGVTTGLLFFTAGPLGTALGLWLTNRQIARGRKDATMIALLIGILIGVPTFVLFPLMPTVNLAVGFLFFAFIGQAIATAAGPASLIMLAPGSIRAQATAVYYLVISVIGLVLGPPPVGWMVDLFGDPRALRYAISIEAAVIGLPALAIVSYGLKFYRRGAEEAARSSEILSIHQACSQLPVGAAAIIPS